MSKSRLFLFALSIMLLTFGIACTPTVEPSANDSSVSDSESGALNPAADVESEAAQEMIDLAGTSWKLVSHNQDGSQVAVLDGTEISINFTDGQINGSAGCNNFFGSYTQEGDLVTVTGVGATRKACEQNIMDQESAFLEALGKADGVTISDGSLNMRSGSTATLILEQVEG